MRLNLDKRIAQIFENKGKVLQIAFLAILALILIFIGSVGNEKTDETDENLEDRVAQMCSMTEGVGDCTVMITYTSDGDIYAVAVLCDGAESVAVRERVTSLICSLFGVGANRVEILKIKK